MILFDNYTKNAYKDFTREIKVYGNLYLAKKRVSNNLFDATKEVFLNSGASYEQTTGTIKATATLNRQWNYVAIKLDDNVLGKTIYFKSNFYSTSTYPGVYLFNLKNNEIRDQLAFDRINNRTVGKLSFNYTFPSSYPSDVNGYVLLFYANTTTSEIGSYTTYSNIMVSENNIDYEPYGKYVNDYNVLNTPTTNLLNQSEYLALNNLTYSNGTFTQIQADGYTNPSIQLQSYNNDTYIEQLGYKILSEQDERVYFQFTKTDAFNIINYKVNGQQRDSIIRFDVSNLENNKTYYIGATFLNKTQGHITWCDMYINEDNSVYERYNSTPFKLTEENECKILSFNINEQLDVYYTSLPYNVMEIEVDNEKGYFTDYDQDSIVNKLNQDCYVDLFMKINDGDYKKIMSMKFDEISSSDYEKAKLNFKSSLSLIKNLPLKDNDMYFKIATWTRENLKIYLSTNYNIGFVYPHYAYAVDSLNFKTTSVENMLLECGTWQSDLQFATLVTSDYQDNITLKNWLASPQETIIKDYQDEKPIIKRENTYQGVDYYYINTTTSQNYEATTETYSRSISGTLQTSKEVIVYRDNDYRLSDLSVSNLSTSSGVTLSIATNTTNNPNILIIVIGGYVGQEYTINISKSNIYRRTANDIRQTKFGLVNDTAKVLTIKETSPLLSNYYQLIMNEKTIRSYVEAKIYGLPYLEVGDTVEVQTDNANILITISEIDMNYDGGLIETIKGYELGWDALFPADDLYPSDDLYPNTPI